MDGVPGPVEAMLAVEGPLPVGGGWAYETKWDFCTRFGPVGRRPAGLTVIDLQQLRRSEQLLSTVELGQRR